MALLSKMPIGLFKEGGRIRGWLFQFDYANPPVSSVGSMEPIREPPEFREAKAGYQWIGHVKKDDTLVITGRLILVNETAADLSAYDLAFSFARFHYSNSYLPIADIIIKGNQTLIPGMDLWGAIGIPLDKSALDTIRAMKQLEASFIREKADLQTQLSNIQKELASTQGQVKTLQTDLKSAQDTITSLQSELKTLQTEKTALEDKVSTLGKENTALKAQTSSLENDKASLQNEVSSKQSQIDSLRSQLSQTQTTMYGISAAAVVLLLLAVVLALRRRR